MSNQYVAVTDVVQNKSPQVCRKGSPRARRSRPLLLRRDGQFGVPRLLKRFHLLHLWQRGIRRLQGVPVTNGLWKRIQSKH